ncbi:MAG: sugar transferase [Paracoccus sp. (in: a-proteobacteria)]|uniref:sugar transferase n=1 Tax=Paracoccus sp. TaxID=267 RepID=UPI004059421D
MIHDDRLLDATGAELVGDFVSFEPHNLYMGGGKRLLDTAMIIAALPFILPIMLIVAVLVAFDGGSPIYSQTRLGRGWKSFRLYKFRTMKTNSAELLAAHLAANPEAKAEWDLNQKLRNDPRITWAGRFLRKTSLDELPQLINVLLGQMSLVGPRPIMVEQRPLYPGHYYAAHRPGLTGLWQVSARNGTTFAARAIYDERYYRDLSLGLDISTIIRTFVVVARCTGC